MCRHLLMGICLKNYNFKFPGSLQNSFSFYFLLVQHFQVSYRCQVSYRWSNQGLLLSQIFPEHVHSPEKVLSLVGLQAYARAFHFPVVIQCPGFPFKFPISSCLSQLKSQLYPLKMLLAEGVGVFCCCYFFEELSSPSNELSTTTWEQGLFPVSLDKTFTVLSDCCF